MFARIVFRIRSSIRAFAKTPGISLALLTSIALGVGSNASIGGFIAGLAHPGSSVSSSNQIVSIFAHDRSSDAGPLSDAEYREIRNRARAFSWVDAVRIAPIEVVLDGHPKTLMTASVMPELAKALNLRFKGGVVLSDRLFESLGGGNGETGSRILINNHQLPISGVAPRTLEGIYEDRPIDLWMPYEDGAGHDANPNRRDLWVLGGLRRRFGQHCAAGNRCGIQERRCCGGDPLQRCCGDGGQRIGVHHQAAPIHRRCGIFDRLHQCRVAFAWKSI
jgi:hypothetical protein